jgi:hypothetical protein
MGGAEYIYILKSTFPPNLGQAGVESLLGIA